MREQRRRVQESYNYTSNGSDSDEYVGQQNGRHDHYEPRHVGQNPQTSQPRQVPRSDRHRYEMMPPSLVDRELDSRGRLVKFYKNGDSLKPAVPVSISQKGYKDMQVLMSELGRKLGITNSVKYIFNLRTGEKVTRIVDFQRGDECVVSSCNSFNNDIEYGCTKPTKSMTSSPFNNSALALRKRHSRNHGSDSEHTPTISRMNYPSPKHVTVTIISNDDRRDRKDVFLNPKTAQQFEQFLKDIGSMMKLHNPPATAMFSARDNDIQINSFSKVFKEVNKYGCNEFIVCGQEREPRKPSAGYSQEYEEQSHSEPEYEPEPTPKALPKQKGTKNPRRSNKDPPMTSRVQKSKPAPKQSSPRKPQRNDEQNEYNSHKKPNRPAPKSYRQEEEEDYYDQSPPRKTKHDEKPTRESMYDRNNDHEPQQPRKDENRRSVPNSQKEGRHLDNENLYGRRQPKDSSPQRETQTQKDRNNPPRNQQNRNDRFDDDDDTSRKQPARGNPPRNQQNRNDRFDDDDDTPKKPPARGKQINKGETKSEDKPKISDEDRTTSKENGSRDYSKKDKNDNRYERENLNSSGNENDDEEEEEEDDDDENRPLSPITPRPRMARMDTPDY